MVGTEERSTQRNVLAVLFNIIRNGQPLHPASRNLFVDDCAMACLRTNVIEVKQTLGKALEYPSIYLELAISSLIRRKLRLVSST